MSTRPKPLWGAFTVCLLVAGTVAATDPADLHFFETRIRPIFVKHCYECHSTDASEVKGGLLLDSAAGLLKGGDSGPALAIETPRESVLINALRYEGLEMPPAGRLPAHIVADFEEWVERGAIDPRAGNSDRTAKQEGVPTIDIQAGRDFWAFRPILDPPPPLVVNEDWPRNDIDRFVLSRLEAAGLRPSEQADPATLLRRLYYDLIGLPPTPADVQVFLDDSRPDAFEQTVNQLLESPQFGVHWGRHWLDVARYADSNGADFNATFHDAWRYRDYVVSAMNHDRPFDQFVREQIAGDLMSYDSDERRAEQLVATGFLMVGTKMLSERDKEKMRMDVIDEQIDTIGTAFMGLTLGCARCHDHKFDPIPSHDYYALAGIFRSTRTLEGESQKYVSTWPRVRLPASPDRVAAFEKFQAEREDLAAELQEAKKSLTDLEEQPDSKSRQDDATSPTTSPTTRLELEKVKAKVKILETRLKEVDQDAPAALPTAIAVGEHSEIGDCQICVRGEHSNLGSTVARGFLQVAAMAAAREINPAQSGRLELADWIASPDHPLTPRVIVNRVWYHLLGEGIVRSVDNFGRLGERPTHPGLLDYLAHRFVSPRPPSDTAQATGFGWSIKRLVREIVMSRAYQMSSLHDESRWRIDPENRMLWRAHRRRLPAEAIRDSMLAISGLLDTSSGGSPVEGLGVLVTQNSAGAKGYDRQESVRRSLYLPIIRNELPPILSVFDFADPDFVTGRRAVTNVPTQALLLMNSPFVMDCADKTTERVLAGREQEPVSERIARLYLAVLSRSPTKSELNRATEYLAVKDPDSGDNQKRMAQLVHVLFASTQFRILN
jgi:hypothetical protein